MTMSSPYEVADIMNAANPTEFGFVCGPYTSFQGPLQLSKANNLICGVTLGAMQCGRTFSANISLRRHILHDHGIELAKSNTHNVTTAEKAAAQNFLTKYALTKGWRHALFLRQPGKYSQAMTAICNQLEDYADDDEAFAMRRGSEFHRASPLPKTKRKRATETVIEPSDEPTTIEEACPPSEKKRRREHSPVSDSTLGLGYISDTLSPPPDKPKIPTKKRTPIRKMEKKQPSPIHLNPS